MLGGAVLGRVVPKPPQRERSALHFEAPDAIAQGKSAEKEGRLICLKNDGNSTC
jgi:hypothetical protein